MYVEKYVYVCRKKLRTTKMTKSKKDKEKSRIAKVRYNIFYKMFIIKC